MAYKRHTWINGETITAAKMNNIESGIAEADAREISASAAASVENTTGEPSCEVTAEGSVASIAFDFAFKGIKGEQGIDAGFGAPSATAVTLEPNAEATVSVSASGEDTAKVFEFAFGIPKGAAAGFGKPAANAATLEPGSEATVSVTASGEDTEKVFAFSFGIPKGEKGDTGEKGEKGEKGEPGEGFSVYKTYASVDEMEADAGNVEEGKFVLIASDVEDEDNAKLYAKGADSFTFLTDLSGAQGIKGEKGEQGEKGDDGAAPLLQKGEEAIQVSYDNGGEWKDLVALEELKGEKGDSGEKGEDGVTPLFQKTDTAIQVSYDSGTSWEDLVQLADIRGADGAGGASVDYTVGGDGTYYAYTVAGLLAWAAACESDMGTNCVLMNSLDMAGVEWTPVGTEEKPFTGAFEGGSNALINLTVNMEAESGETVYAGFFGYMGEGSSVSSLSLRGNTITANGQDDACAGGIAGASFGTIANCQNAGAITANGQGDACAGGIAGGNAGTIANCQNAGAITANGQGETYAGGIAGGNAGTIASCQNAGAVTASGSGEAYAGGIVGRNYFIIMSCLNTGTAEATSSSGDAYAGGIAGFSYKPPYGCISCGTSWDNNVLVDTTYEIYGWPDDEE